MDRELTTKHKVSFLSLQETKKESFLINGWRFNILGNYQFDHIVSEALGWNGSECDGKISNEVRCKEDRWGVYFSCSRKLVRLIPFYSNNAGLNEVSIGKMGFFLVSSYLSSLSR
ncbi:hypothetical protein Tco_0248415 [Tanacetum coccineum]